MSRNIDPNSEAPWRYALLLATRGRPWNLERLSAAIHSSAVRPDLVDIWVYVDEDDPQLEAYQATETPTHRLIVGPRVRLAATWNALAQLTQESGHPRHEYTHFLLWGDDVIPETPGWDLHIAKRAADAGPGWFYGRDGIWDDRPWDEHPEHLVLPTATAMSVELYRALSYVAPPGLVHLCIDLAWRDLGIRTGTLHCLPGVMIRHVHRLVGAPNDLTYIEANEGEQARNDHMAYDRWKHSDRFTRDVEKIGALVASQAVAERLSRADA